MSLWVRYRKMYKPFFMPEVSHAMSSLRSVQQPLFFTPVSSQLRLVSCKLRFPKVKKNPKGRHRRNLAPATVSNFTLGANRCVLPLAIHWLKFLHWETSNALSLWQPSTIASTPTPVTRTHPRTERSSSSSRCSPMLRREESLTALPQKERLRRRR